MNKTTFNFSSFYKKFTEFYPNSKKPDVSFLEWFIGFSEGEALFILAKRGDLAFVIVQSTSDVKVLNYIKDNLSFGKVIVESNKQKTHKYVVQDMKNIYLICELFNGNIIFPTKKARFISFISIFNENLIKKDEISIPIINSSVIASLNDCWLLGITDAKGCFSSSILSNSSAYRIRYILTYKWDVNRVVFYNILNLFNPNKNIGSVVTQSEPNIWELRLNGVKNCEMILNYFDKYNLKTNKITGYFIWKKLLYKLKYNKDMDNNERLVLKQLSKKVNKKWGKKDVI